MPPSVFILLAVGVAAGLGLRWWWSAVLADADRFVRAARPLVTTSAGRRLVRWCGVPRPVVRLLTTRTAHRHLRRGRARTRAALVAVATVGTAIGWAVGSARWVRRRLVCAAAVGRLRPAPGPPSAW